MTEQEKMLAGKIYDPADENLATARARAHRLCKLYNDTFDADENERKNILDELLPTRGEGAYLQGPIYFDYGIHTSLGKSFYVNSNFTVLDVCRVTIGDNVFIGPNVSIFTPIHPLRWQDRNMYVSEKGTMTNKEYGAPVTIGDNCWIAGNVTILAGSKIGSGCVIGAGSVVSGEIPDHSVAYGVPCRVARAVTEHDGLEYHRELF